MVADLDRGGDSDLTTISARDVSYRLNVGSRFGTAQRIYAIPSGSNPPDVILLNNGALTFTTLAVRSATGVADEVIAVQR